MPSSSSLTTRVGFFLALLCALIATNPLYIKSFQSSSQSSGTLLNRFTTAWSSVTTKSTQNYILFSVRNKRTISTQREIGLLTQWFAISKESIPGQMLHTKASSGREDPFVQAFTLNVVILLFWTFMSRRADGEYFMTRHFTASRSNLASGRIYTLLTSAFSHSSVMHLFWNLLMLFNVLTSVYPATMTRFELLCFTVASGVFASSTSVLINNFVRGRRVQLLGFSGCTYGLFTVAAIAHPNTRWSMFGMNLSSSEFLVGSLFLDFFIRGGTVDVFCHAGGILYGYLWMHACRNGWADGLCSPITWAGIPPPDGWELDGRRWSLLWWSVWIGCGVTALCMWRRD